MLYMTIHPWKYVGNRRPLCIAPGYSGVMHLTLRLKGNLLPAVVSHGVRSLHVFDIISRATM